MRRKDKRLIRVKTYREIQIPDQEKCYVCKINDATIRHHPNYENPSKIYFLCRKCHGLVHKLAGDFKNRKFIPDEGGNL